MEYLPAIFALLVMAAGWFYMFYSQAAQKLESLESARANAHRVRLRRLNGFMMMLLGIAFYAGFKAVDAEVDPERFMLVWSGVVVLLGIIVVLALLDVRLTWNLRRNQNQHKP